MRFWNRYARMAGGMMAMIDAAAISLGCETWKNMVESAGGKVCAVEPAARICEKVNSFQQIRKLIAAATEMPGHDMGRITRVNAWKRVLPSTRAAASTVRGSELKKLVITHTTIGTVSVR